MFFYKCFPIKILFLSLSLFGHLGFVELLLGVDPFCDLVNRQFILIFRHFFKYSHSFRDLVRINRCKLREDLVFVSVDMHYLLNVQTVDHVFSYDERSANHYLVHIFARQRNQHAFLSALKRELISHIV
jgi:hypothetical protein